MSHARVSAPGEVHEAIRKLPMHFEEHGWLIGRIDEFYAKTNDLSTSNRIVEFLEKSRLGGISSSAVMDVFIHVADSLKENHVDPTETFNSMINNGGKFEDRNHMLKWFENLDKIAWEFMMKSEENDNFWGNSSEYFSPINYAAKTSAAFIKSDPQKAIDITELFYMTTKCESDASKMFDAYKMFFRHWLEDLSPINKRE